MIVIPPLVCMVGLFANLALIDGPDGIRWFNLIAAMWCAVCLGWTTRTSVEMGRR